VGVVQFIFSVSVLTAVSGAAVPHACPLGIPLSPAPVQHFPADEDKT